MASKQPALDFLSFVNAAPTRTYICSFYSMIWNVTDLSSLAFHAVHEAKKLLTQAGFQEIKVSTNLSKL
jgi:aspartyl aminopeptidase